MPQSIKYNKLSLISIGITAGAIISFAVTAAAGAAEPSSADKDFMKNTALAGMTEIKLGKIAEKNSTDKQVLGFAGKMIADHTNASNHLHKVAADEKVALPADLDAKHKAVVEKLSALKGAKFDHDYMGQMAEDHKGVVDAFEAEQKIASGELKNFVDKTLPVIQGHLKMAEDWVKSGK